MEEIEFVNGSKIKTIDNAGDVIRGNVIGHIVNEIMYECYLNGKFYGSGNLEYMHELFKDYVVACQMYGKRECEFKVVRCN